MDNIFESKKYVIDKKFESRVKDEKVEMEKYG